MMSALQVQHYGAMGLTRAHWLAGQVQDHLAGAVERATVVGAARRGVLPFAVELAVIPCVVEVAVERQAHIDLFTVETQTETVRRNLLDARCEELRAAGVLVPRVSVRGRAHWGNRAKHAWFHAGRGEVVPLNLYACLPPAQWGVLLLLRTGPADFVHLLVSRYGGGEGGGLLPGYQMQDGCLRDGGRRTLETPAEEDVFAALALPFIPPPQRTVWALRAAIRRREAILQREAA